MRFVHSYTIGIEHRTAFSCVFKVSQLVALIVLRIILGIVAKQSEFFPFCNAVIVFVIVAVINNRVYKACVFAFNFKYNIAILVKAFGNNLAKVHIAVNFGKVNAARRIGINCVVSCISFNTIMNVAVNKQSAAIFFIITANAAAVGLQGNTIAADNSNLTLLTCTVQ